MKLNNQQVKVLASEIHSELEVQANKYKESSEYVNFEDSLKGDSKYKAFVKLEKDLKAAHDSGIIDINSWHSKSILENKQGYVEDLKRKAFPSPKLPSITSIENKIILNTIEVDNLEELIVKVKNSLNK